MCEEFGEIGIIGLPGHCLRESVSEASPSQTLLNLKSTASRLSELSVNGRVPNLQTNPNQQAAPVPSWT